MAHRRACDECRRRIRELEGALEQERFNMKVTLQNLKEVVAERDSVIDLLKRNKIGFESLDDKVINSMRKDNSEITIQVHDGGK